MALQISFVYLNVMMAFNLFYAIYATYIQTIIQ